MMNEEKMEDVRMLEAQIQHLQTEVSALQDQLQDQQKNMAFNLGDQMQTAILLLEADEEEKEEFVLKLKEEVEELRKTLRWQAEINGISMKSCKIKTLQSSGSKQVQHLFIAGHCGDMDFQMEFWLSEIKEAQGSKRMISNLNVVMDAFNLRSFSSLLSGMEEDWNLLLFFRTLRTFSNRCDERRQTFQHFQTKYPSVVSLPGGCRSEVMTLSHPELPSCRLLVRWSLEVSREGKVTPKINVLSKIPERALQFCPQPAGGAADAFQSLLRVLGPEAAIESIIRAVSLSSDP
ncbi:centromere protein P isoform X1 [Takifugu flavidus]|uniref:centromere protein P isoform X1 n=1 Tax=Takifugu flavidus TaxID=433684 RepID=UPI002544A8A3|nr:centromere protein P isoform X1 [Takifugu flavidus]